MINIIFCYFYLFLIFVGGVYIALPEVPLERKIRVFLLGLGMYVGILLQINS